VLCPAPLSSNAPAREWWSGLWATLRVLLVLCALSWLVSVVRFARMSGGVADYFTALATGPYLGTAIWSQVRVIPAYALFGLAMALVVWPLMALSAGTSTRAARSVRTVSFLGWTAAVLLLASAAFLRTGGLFDTVARKLPAIDLYALVRLRVLDGAAWVLLGLGALAAAMHLRVLWSTRARWPATVGCFVVLVGIGSPFDKLWVNGGESKPAGKPNVLILATDSWRFDRVGVHGAARADITPNVDAFAKDAVDFTGMHVATGSTLESWVTFLTGQFPPTHGIRSMYPAHAEVQKVAQSPGRLPAMLAAQGYDTFVSSDWAGNHFELVDLGFERRHVGAVQNFKALIHEATVRSHLLVTLFFAGLAPPVGDWLVPGRSALAANLKPSLLPDRLFDEIDASRAHGKPFFGVLFASPTHLPYNARYPFNSKYVAPGYRGAHRYQVEVSAHELITTGFAPTLPPQTVQHIRDLYDGAVSDFDDTVGLVLRGLEERGLAKDTIVILTTDHGEDLYDPGSTLGHGTNFFGGDQNTRIPFLVRVPTGQGWLRPGAKVEAITRNADVAPTLLELLKLPVPESMEGVSLASLLRGEAADLSLPAFAETCYLFFPKKQALVGLSEAERARVVDLAGAGDTLEVDAEFDHNFVLRPKYRQSVIDAKDRMVRTARWKLVEVPGKDAPIRRLYDMEKDPGQTTDLSGQGLPEEAALAELLGRYWRGEGKALRTTSDPVARAGSQE
jgi:arylsulfatase A-like enzyme